ncbi:MAG TPA: DUF4070 domain-containing protein, partial [Candidatus Nanoarchaeia archaeon]|nr:DUF4070 domain-containing protein [Candidatus Nanoarchaeia archaeon]
NCEFCGIIAMNGREPRTKSSGQVIAELDSLYRAGWRGSVFFVDDNFIGNRAKVNEVLKHIIEWQRNHRFPFVFMTEASLNLANDDEIMHLMSQANFDSVFIGIETPCIESLKECGKHQNVNVDVAQAIKKIHKRGMQVLGGFILGFDSDNDSIFQTQIDFIQKIGVAMAMVGLLNALPNTRLWYRLKEEGRLTGATSGENTDGSMNFIPRMGEDKLKKGYRKVLNTIYCPKSYFQRVSKFLSDYKPTAKTEIKPAQVYAFVRSIWSIGILSRARFRYWKILINTMLFNFRALPAAITLSIFWLHFSKVAHNIE